MSDSLRKSVDIRATIWYNEADESIHVAIKDYDLISTVNEKDGNARCHKNLFMKLKKILETEEKI